MTYPNDGTSSTYSPDDSSSAYTPSASPSAYMPDASSPAYGSDSSSAYGNQTTPASSTGAPDASTTDVAKQQASEVAGSVGQASAQVAETAKEQIATVAAETQAQAKNLLQETRHEMTDQAGQQQQRVAQGLRSLSGELQSMAGSSGQDGPVTQLAQQAADRIDTVASWLEDRDPGQVLTDAKLFARQRPGAFLALAAAAGLAVGRLTRGLTDDGGSSSRDSATMAGDRATTPAPISAVDAYGGTPAAPSSYGAPDSQGSSQPYGDTGNYSSPAPVIGAPQFAGPDPATSEYGSPASTGDSGSSYPEGGRTGL